MGLIFAWDPQKERLNIKKHAITFSEASTVFNDAHGITIYDPDHSNSEDRFILFGWSTVNRLLLVVHVELSDTIRIISARELTRTERTAYEKEIIRRQGL